MTATDTAPTEAPAPSRGNDELRAAAWVVGAAVALSVLGGLAWGLLAPAQDFLVVSADSGASLTGESSHRFDALAIFLCIGGVVGVLTAVAGWLRRRMRGPMLYAGMLVGTAIGAAVMQLLGEWVAKHRYPRSISPQLHQVIAIAPTVGSAAALYAAPFVMSLVVLVFALLSPRDDLGAHRPVRGRTLPESSPESASEPAPQA